MRGTRGGEQVEGEGQARAGAGKKARDLVRLLLVMKTQRLLCVRLLKLLEDLEDATLLLLHPPQRRGFLLEEFIEERVELSLPAAVRMGQRGHGQVGTGRGEGKKDDDDDEEEGARLCGP